MSVCTAHEYAGPQPCPYCGVAALDRVLVEALKRIDEQAVTIERLRKECAMCCLQLLDRALFVDEAAGLQELRDGKTDPAVLDLVKEHRACPLGVCDRCERPAPLIDETGVYADRHGEPYVETVCAWGCPP